MKLKLPHELISGMIKDMDKAVRSTKRTYTATDPNPGASRLYYKKTDKDDNTHKKWRRYQKSSLKMRHPKIWG